MLRFAVFSMIMVFEIRVLFFGSSSQNGLSFLESIFIFWHKNYVFNFLYEYVTLFINSVLTCTYFLTIRMCIRLSSQ